MKRSILVCLAFSMLACQHMGVASDPNRHDSRFGFQAQIPGAWEVLNAEDVPQSALEEPTGALANIDPELLADFSRAIRQGEVEVFFRPNPAVLGFTDNVSVRSAPGALPDAKEDVLVSCDVLAQTLSAAYGRPVSLALCEVREVVSRRSLCRGERRGRGHPLHAISHCWEEREALDRDGDIDGRHTAGSAQRT
jgi:hypothetical protein